MKIAVVGSREFKYPSFISDKMINLFGGTYNLTFISGGALGVDSIAEKCVDDFNETFHANITKVIYKPNWEKYGKKAGFLRNQQIVDEAEKLIAFWDGESKGTKNSIDLAIKKGIPVDIYIRK